MELTVNETGDKVKHKFTVKPSNPELDNMRPDFARMYEMASYADEDVQPRMSARRTTRSCRRSCNGRSWTRAHSRTTGRGCTST